MKLRDRKPPAPSRSSGPPKSQRAPNLRRRNPITVRMPRARLQVNNLQRRRFRNTLEVDIEGCTTIGDLKKSIGTQESLSVIPLLYRGVPLDDTRQLAMFLPDARIGPPRFAVHTRLRPRAIEGGVSVNVLTLTRKTFQVHLHSLQSTLLELKEAIKDYEGISRAQVALTCGGKQLNEPDFSTLRECNLEQGSTVHLVGRLRGGFMPRLSCGDIGVGSCYPHPLGFVDMENTSLMRKLRLNTRTAPEWRVCGEGLGVEGECGNQECPAFGPGKPVICPLGFTAFNLQEEIHSPVCNTAIQALTCGFRKCLWMFEGRKTGVGAVDVTSQWMMAGSGYERFEAVGEHASAAQWSSLIITTKQLPSTKNMKAFHGSGECPICHEEFTASSSQCTVKYCQHAFHRECLQGWEMTGKTTCPMCSLLQD